MSETADQSTEPNRTRVDRPTGEQREWEVFRRAAIDEPLKHVGSVTAATAEVAHERAATLFPNAAGLWLCPTETVARFETATLDSDR